MNLQYSHSRNKIKKKILETNKSENFKNYFTKIRKYPIYNAFERKNLGSIPSKFDYFVFKLENPINQNQNFKLNKFNSEKDIFNKESLTNRLNSWRNNGKGNSFEIKGNILKLLINNDLQNLEKNTEFNKKNIDSYKPLKSYSINANISSNISNNSNRNNKSQNDINLSSRRKINKNKSEPKMKFSKEDRYFNIYYKNNILEKYFPGPADYDPQIDLENKHNYRYYSLFKNRVSFPIYEIKTPTADIGPGSYDLVKDPNIPGGNFSKLKKYDNFNSPFNICDKDIKTSPGENNLPSSINIKNIYKNNYFFMLDTPKRINLEKKFGLDRNDIKQNKNIIEKIENKNWDKGRSINVDWITPKLDKIIKEKIKEGNILLENLKINSVNKHKRNQIDFYNNNNYEAIKNKGKVFSFNKIPRFYEPLGKHVPGPSYYDPEKILYGIKLKKSFNAKEEGWI